jgi:SAM-dependent methyltransferase
MHPESILAISDIQSGIRSIEREPALREEANFMSRMEAIDFLDFHIIDRIEGWLQKEGPNEKLSILEKLPILKNRAEQAKRELEMIDINMFQQLREKIRTGTYTHPSFRDMIHLYLGYDGSDSCSQGQTGYDQLDVFLNGLLADRPIPEPTIARAPEMVFYQKTPVRIIFELTRLAELKPGDLFFDIGSGLGQVCILVNLISGAATRGIEFEPAYCHYAKTTASQLNLPNVDFLSKDARDADYARGTVFFLYTPFEGRMLQDMLDILQKEAQKRAISIFAYGPCSPHVARQDWLYGNNDGADNPAQLYQFRSLFPKKSKT